MTIPAQRELGGTGYAVSEIGLGCWQLGGDWGALPDGQAEAVLEAASQAGVNFWDTADVYGGGESERIIGAFNQAHPDPQRIIVTKAGRNADLYPDGYRRDTLRASIEASRERLQVETLDLVQLHCIPFAEIQRGAVFEWLDECRQDGLIRYYGASVETVEEATYCLEHTQVASLQLIVNLLRQDMTETVLPLAKEQDVGVIVRLGLASGLLSGKMQKDKVFAAEDHRNFNRDGDAFFVGETFAGLPYETGVDLAEQLKAYCPQGVSLPQLALRWLLDQPAVSSVITGASRPEQIRDNAAVSAMALLPAELHQQLGEFYRQQVRHQIRGAI
ncbi:aldo/keto reductase [Saccharospirillum sp. MSK14-1]|uniref:aldo/keto reductase n=1 Tax=Saccharospirillum sp. MSK14-1 TaxID=1897632 RepID=UPI000D3C003D|nr:aldo/keto reductase [Saccharospirillum sp. MSK14-1]PTY37606.1 aldo/keto reductase [Saccharospirillum sp. MSK14-1]